MKKNVLLKEIFDEIQQQKMSALSSELNKVEGNYASRGMSQCTGVIMASIEVWNKTLNEILSEVIKKLEDSNLTKFIKRNDEFVINSINKLVDEAIENIVKKESHEPVKEKIREQYKKKKEYLINKWDTEAEIIKNKNNKMPKVFKWLGDHIIQIIAYVFTALISGFILHKFGLS